MKYASVIVTFNRKHLLEKAIESLLTQACPAYKIIIVDNASTDGTREVMSKYRTNNAVCYHRLDSNMGGAMGFYVGLQIALKMDIDWISLSDDDAVYKPDFFEKVSKEIDLYPDIRCFTGTVKSKDGTLQLMHRRLMKNEKSLQEIKVPSSMYENDFFLDGFTFVGVILSKSLVSSIGLPEKDFFIWKDDDEYSLRVRKQTCIRNVSEAEIVHLNNNNKKKFSPDWKEYYGIRNRLIIEKKYTKLNLRLCFKNISFIMKRVLAIVVKPSHHKYAKYLIHQLVDGYVDGIRGVRGINKHYLP